MSRRTTHSKTHAVSLFQLAFDLKVNDPWEFITKIYVSLVHAIFTNRGSSSLYFSTANIHPNKTVNKKKSRKCKKQGIKKFLILVLYPSKM